MKEKRGEGGRERVDKGRIIATIITLIGELLKAESEMYTMYLETRCTGCSPCFRSFPVL